MSACWRWLALIDWRSTRCTPTVMARISGTAISITITRSPPTNQIMPMNRKMNGRSLMADIVAEVENSRTTSSCARWWANEPDDSGRFSSRIDSALRNRIAPSARSAFLPARSIRWLRNWRATRSNTIAMPAPAASDHSVTKAL